MIALYPGTFDPITNGHFEIIRRASTIFQVLVVGVAVSDEKKPLFEHEKRLSMVNEVLNAFCGIFSTFLSFKKIDFGAIGKVVLA